MGWFPTSRDRSSGWHFDIVGLLAVIGESSMANHSQLITASWTCVLPRLIPAPQALLATTRPARLPATKENVEVMAIYGGTHVKELNYFADLIHEVGSLKAYEFQVWDVGFAEKVERERQAARDAERDGRALRQTAPTVAEWLWSVAKDSERKKAERKKMAQREKQQRRKRNKGTIATTTTTTTAAAAAASGNNDSAGASSHMSEPKGIVIGGENTTRNDAQNPPLGSAPADSAQEDHNTQLPARGGAGGVHDEEKALPLATADTTADDKNNLNDTDNADNAEAIAAPSPDPVPKSVATASSNGVSITPTRTDSPLNLLAIASALMTAGLFAWAAIIEDGVACIAVITISLSTCLTCISSLWRPELAKRSTTAIVPDGDLIIKTRAGAFVVVHCNEEIARELYTGTEKCEYLLDSQWHQALVGISTALFMVAVVLLGNCEWTMQAAIGAAYIILNGAYWGIAMIPHNETLSWDMSRWDVQRDHDVDNALEGKDVSFTRTLWYAIRETKQTEWIMRGGVCPQTGAWSDWVKMAQENCHNPDWDALTCKNDLMAKATLDQERASRRGGGGAESQAAQTTTGTDLVRLPDIPHAPNSPVESS